jgi:predicted nucleic acid-binding protein
LKPKDALNGVTRLGIDANVILTILNGEVALLPFCLPFLQAIQQREIDGIVSSIIFTECLVVPYRTNDTQGINNALALLEGTAGMNIIPVSDDIAKTAARLRASYRLKTPDSLHVATAIESGCEAFLTNDTDIARVTEIPVIILQNVDLT